MRDDPLYRDEILDHYYSSPHRGRLEHPDRRAELDNPLCGDTLSIELAIDPGGRIASARFEGEGCVISQAAASLLAGHIEGRGVAQTRGMPADEMLRLIGIPLTPARRKCGLLAWRTLRAALAADDGGVPGGSEGGPAPTSHGPPPSTQSSRSGDLR